MFGHQHHPSLESAQESKMVLERELNRKARIVQQATLEGPRYRVILTETKLPDGWHEVSDG